MLRPIATAALLLLSACQPPAADEYVARVGLKQRDAPAVPLDSPDTEDAAWVQSSETSRIVYGVPGGTPLMSLACVTQEGAPAIRYTRNVPADPRAQAVLALIGNGHVVRFWIDAVRDGARWTWAGSVPVDDPGLDALTGGRRIEATVPGAGSVILNPSALPAALVNSCRARAPGRARQDRPEGPA